MTEAETPILQVSDRRILRERAILGLNDALYLSNEIIGLKDGESPRQPFEIEPYYKWLARPWPENLPKKLIWKRFWSVSRHSGKSIGLAVEIFRRLIRDPDLVVIWQSEEKQGAADIVNLIRSWFESPEIIRLYGEFESGNWLRTEFTLSQRTRPQKDPSIRALGMDNPMQGKRCDIMVFDDMIGETNCNDEGIQKVERRIASSMPLVRNGGTVFYLCTRWSPYDPSTEGFTISGEPGILHQWKHHNPADGPPPWDCVGPRGYFGAIAQEGDDRFWPHAKLGEPLFPSVLPEEKIEQDRRTMTHGFFASQILNDPIPEETRPFSPELLEHFDHYDEHGNKNPALQGTITYMAIDPNSGKAKSVSKDDSTIAVANIKWLERDLFEVYLLEWIGGRWKTDKFYDQFFRLVEEYRPYKIYPEVNVGKDWLMDPLYKRARELGFGKLPIEEVNQSLYGTGSKTTRILETLQPLYAYGKIKHSRKLKNTKGEIQLVQWMPDGSGHDDYPDVLATLIHHATKQRHMARGSKQKRLSLAGPARYRHAGLG